MNLKSAALFALIGTSLLTLLLAVGFIRDVLGLAQGAVALAVVLASAIHLLASLSLAVFFLVFHRARS